MARGPATRERPARPVAQPAHPGVFRRRRLVAVLLTLLVVAGIGVGVRVLIYDAGLTNVDRVDVSGLKTLSADEVVAVAAVPLGIPLGSVDTAAVATRVATLPAVASVQVARSWPHAVTVEVTERIPVAQTMIAGGPALVDATGAVYVGVVPPTLPRLSFGTAGPDDPATRSALAALAAFPSAVAPEIRTIEVDNASATTAGQVEFGLSGNRRVRWGGPDRGADKAAVLVPLLTQPGHVFDVASPDLPTIRR